MKLPPYGKMGKMYWDAMASDNIARDWLPTEPRREELWKDWLASMRLLIADNFWPAFDPVSTKWIGGAQTFAEDLTALEIKLMISEFQGALATLDTKPNVPHPLADSNKHRFHFQSEDGGKPFGTDFREYDSRLPAWLTATVPPIMRDCLRYKVASGILYLKACFVKTRPYQASMMFGETAFNSETAATSLTSSTFSGHALQGILVGCALFETWTAKGLLPDKDAELAIAQYAVDIGDRRVFAGVHYPTDNVASWVLAIHLIPQIFSNSQAVLAFAKNAIEHRSLVYKALCQYETSSSLFAKPMLALRTAMSST